MIVVDANIIAYLLIRGERSEAMDRLLEHDPEWIAPQLWLDGFLNVLSTYERRGDFTEKLSKDLLEEALNLMGDHSYSVPPDRILEVARRTGCSGYDSQYVALAQDLGVPLYTCDRRILDQCPAVAVEPS